MNYYEILGVNANATEQQIKEGYRREAMKWHPDRHEGAIAKREADRRFKDLAQAYRTLSNPDARAEYDRQLEQNLRHEYEARQQEQARQQRAQSEQEKREQARQRQAWQEPPRPEFVNTGPQFEEESVSSDDANHMFFEQMLDLAFELAGRGFPEEKISKALIALGCPAAMARAVAKLAAKRGRGDGTTQSGMQPVAPVIENFDDATWEQLEPYYTAAIIGNKAGQPLSDSRYLAVQAKRKNRWDLWVGLGFVCVVLTAIAGFLNSITRSDIFSLLIGVSLLSSLCGLIAKNIFIGPDRKPFIAERRRRYYLDAFKVQHLERRGSPALNSFNWAAFFLSYGWLGYRRLSGLAYTVMFINSMIGFAFIILASGALFFLSIPAMWMVNGAVGLYGNRLYFNMVHAKIRSTVDGIPQRQTIQVLRKSGGPNIYGWIGPTLLGIVLGIPGFVIQNERAQDVARAEQKEHAEKVAAQQKAHAERVAAEQAAAVERERLAQEQANTEAKRRYIAYLSQVESMYPFLNQDSPQHDSKAIAWVSEKMDYYKSTGQYPEQALRSAIRDMEEVIRENQRRNY